MRLRGERLRVNRVRMQGLPKPVGENSMSRGIVILSAHGCLTKTLLIAVRGTLNVLRDQPVPFWYYSLFRFPQDALLECSW